MKHVTITIKVAYDEATVGDLEKLELALHERIDDVVSGGMLTPSDEIIDELDVRVEVHDGR